jgi:hypothetical protein
MIARYFYHSHKLFFLFTLYIIESTINTIIFHISISLKGYFLYQKYFNFASNSIIIQKYHLIIYFLDFFTQ